MAKLTRAHQKVFADNAGATEIEQIGSLRNGSQVFTTNPVTLQALSQYDDGLLACVSSLKLIPALEDINAIYFLFSRQLAYILQEGVPEYDATTEYHQNSIIKETGTTNEYYSRTNNNTGNALSNQTHWLPRDIGSPPGTYLMVGVGITNAVTDSEMIARGFAKCNGTTPAAQGVVNPLITITMPNINNGAFLRANTTAWTTGGASGGADTINIAHTHTGPSHTHTGPSHTHTGTASGTTGAGSAHSHGGGTLQFETGYSEKPGAQNWLYMYNKDGYIRAVGYDNSADRNFDGATARYLQLDGMPQPQTYWTKPSSASGTSATESSHTHSFSDGFTTSAGGTGATGSSGTGATSSSLSSSQSVVPVYYNAVCYMKIL